jgi:hypothetical protein
MWRTFVRVSGLDGRLCSRVNELGTIVEEMHGVEKFDRSAVVENEFQLERTSDEDRREVMRESGGLSGPHHDSDRALRHGLARCP